LIENFDRFNFAIHKEKEMADFRRWFLVFAALVLVLGSAVPASAQGPQVSCSVNTNVTPTLRAQGLTELVGDILLICQSVPGHPLIYPPNTLPTADISVSLGATLSTSSLGLGLDALLLIDDPSPVNQTVCTNPVIASACPVAADGGGTFNQPGRYNVFQGIPTPAPGLNSITFLGVPIDPPATGSLTYRITNIRIQAPSVTPFQYGLVPVPAYVSVSSNASIGITSTYQPVVGYVANGLIFSASGTNPPLLQCIGSNGNVTVGTMTFWEGFAGAFKIVNSPGGQTQPGAVYGTESGLQVTIPDVGTSGLASTATELAATITNIPAGVQLWVDAAATDTDGLAATLVSPSAATSGLVEVIDTTGNANDVVASVNVVWAISGQNPSAFSPTTLGISSLSFNVYTTFTGAPGTGGGSPATGVTAYAQGGFWPQPSGGWVNGGPVPEFVVGFSPAAPGQSLFTVSLCQTILLFPYVTDYYGFDTGIAISNTSLDNTPVPAAPQTGSCSVAFYDNGALSTNIGTTGNTPGYINSDVSYGGSTIPGPLGVILPGQTWAFSLSETDAAYNSGLGSGATGYAIATCNFQYAHGYSFVSDTGIRNFAAAYLALIIPDAPRSPNPFLCSAIGGPPAGVGCLNTQTGEQLVH
jgi:hypothetical protein